MTHCISVRQLRSNFDQPNDKDIIVQFSEDLNAICTSIEVVGSENTWAAGSYHINPARNISGRPVYENHMQASGEATEIRYDLEYGWIIRNSSYYNPSDIYKSE